MKEMIKNVSRKYAEPTPTFWRKMGDYALVVMVLIEGYLPNLPLTDEQHKWASFIVALLLTSFKFWTNTKSVHSK